ncbi:MAG: hypothetical protein Q7R80_00735 [bacterium]|nr:hypothetical protein [bacterium]
MRLRLQGRSYNEIQRFCGVAKGTLSLWFRSLELPAEARARIAARVREGSMRGLLRRNVRQTALANERHRHWYTSAMREIGRMTKRDLWLIGIALYWGEGTKRGAGHAVAFANSDPETVRCMMRFFREVCDVHEMKFRIAVHAHEGMDVGSIERYWSQVTGIPRTQFHATYLGVSRASQHRRAADRLPNGTVHVRINDTALYHRIMGWIAGVVRRSG